MSFRGHGYVKDMYSARTPTSKLIDDVVQGIDKARWKTMMDRVNQALPPLWRMQMPTSHGRCGTRGDPSAIVKPDSIPVRSCRAPMALTFKSLLCSERHSEDRATPLTPSSSLGIAPTRLLSMTAHAQVPSKAVGVAKSAGHPYRQHQGKRFLPN